MCIFCLSSSLTSAKRVQLAATTDTQHRISAAADSSVISALNGGATWSGTTGQASHIGYSFGVSHEGGSLLTAAGQTAAQSAMQAWANVANVSFGAISNAAATLTFSQLNLSSMGAAGYASSVAQGSRLQSVEVVIDNDYTSFPQGTFSYTVFLHEIGHALGLKHPGSYSTADTGPFLASGADSYDTTVMSYHSGFLSSASPSTPMLYDIAAIQYLYGANTSYNAGDTVYTINSSARTATLWDGGGSDTLAISSGNGYLDLREGEDHLSVVGDSVLWIAFGAHIEHAKGGTGIDDITGNGLGNQLYGMGGNDTLRGEDGADLLFGGAGVADATDGSDILLGGLGYDQLYGNAGNDAIYGGRAEADGNDIQDIAYGGLGRDTLYGNAGDDSLYGGGSGYDPGDTGDTVYGGLGRDQLYGNGGNDKLYGGAALSDPSDAADTLYGGFGDDQLYGNGGDDFIVGQDGNDTLHGGVGNNIFLFQANSGDDVIQYFSGAGMAGGDVIQLVANLNNSGFNDSGDVLLFISYRNGNAFLDLGGGHSLTILGVTGLSADDFSFV